MNSLAFIEWLERRIADAEHLVAMRALDLEEAEHFLAHYQQHLEIAEKVHQERLKRHGGWKPHALARPRPARSSQ